MPRVCEICGRREESEEEQELEMELLDVCPDCSNDRLH